MKLLRKLALFALGGGAYVVLELLWRGRSHISMFCAGGICFLLIGQMSRLRAPGVLKVLAGAGAITLVELTTGLLVNRNFQVWDYRGQPGNFLGQICPAFTVIWLPVTILAMGLYRWADRRLPKAG